MPHKILVVDDDDVVREALRRGFTKRNYDIIEAAEGVEAVEKVKSEKPDAIILDMVMPNLGGLEACRVIRDELNNKELPIIFLSTSEQDWDVLSSYVKGGSVYLVKPLDFNNDFFDKLTGILENYL